jgi:hypothetical protein
MNENGSIQRLIPGFLDRWDIITQPRKIAPSTWYLLMMMVNPTHAFQSFKPYFLSCDANEMENDEFKSLDDNIDIA